MNVTTMSRFYAILALLCFVAVAVVAVGALLRRASPGDDRFGSVRTELGRVALGLAWLVATTSMLGSLYLSEVANFVPCPLCWYQRICMYPLALVLGIAAVRRDRDVRVYAIPLAAVGAAIAVYHSWITAYPPTGGSAFCTAEAPCTERWVWEFGFVSIPLMALAGFLFVITMLLIATPTRPVPEGPVDERGDEAVASAPSPTSRT
jgi:disulfide bond formation protein DsbB